MKLIPILVCVAACGSGLLAQEAARQEAPNTAVLLQFLAAEIRELRRELLEDRIERQQARVQALDRELSQARLDRQQEEEFQRSQNQEMIQVQQRLGDSSLPADERSHLEALRTDLVARQTDRTASTQKEARITDQMQYEQGRLEWLRRLSRSLAPPSASSNN